MSMGWSAEALAILASGTVSAEIVVTIDVEYHVVGSPPAYGTNLNDVSSRVIDVGDLVRASSIIDQNSNTTQAVLRLQNADAYFTPNVMAGGRTQIVNVWNKLRPAGEAKPSDCRVYVDLALRLASGAIETVRLSSGAIADINLSDSNGPVAELVVKDTMLDAFDRTLGFEDGNGGYWNGSSWVPLSWAQFKTARGY